MKNSSWADGYIGLIFSSLEGNKDKINSQLYCTLRGLKSSREKIEYWKGLSEEEKELLIHEDKNCEGI